MIPWAGESPHRHPDTQDSTNIPGHLYLIHPECFAGCAFSQEDLEEIKKFRERIIRLPKDDILKIVTGIQTVRYHVSQNLFLVCDSPHRCKFEQCQCIDGCSIDPESASQRLKLLQDVSTASSLFPKSYWISDVTKGKRISAGGEATVYLGHHIGQTVVIREFHFVELDEFDGSEIERMATVRSLHCCTICFL